MTSNRQQLKKIMSNKTITMSKIRQLLRLYTQGKGKQSISEQTGIARNTVRKYIRVFIDHKLTFEEVNDLSDHELDELFGKPIVPKLEVSSRYIDLQAFFPYAEKELKRTGVTLDLVWKEYLVKHPEGYRHAQFGYHYHLWQKKTTPVMHIQHKAGDKMYVDYAGAKLQVVDTGTGEIHPVEVFVAILGASQLTYVEATFSQQKEDFISSCENALHYFGGVPTAIVPDNLKSAVTKSSKYEPTINESFADFAEHYCTSILPARAYRPRDKALVEGAVKIMYTYIYAALRDHSFFSIEELNQAIWQELALHNQANLKGRNYSRRQQFDEVEKSTLALLPELRYEFKQHMVVTVMKNGHVCLSIDKHYYSVPYRYMGKKVKLIFSKSQLEIFYKYDRIAVHKRIKSPYNYTTIEEHMASTHKFISDWTPEKFITWAENIGEDVKHFIIKILDKKQHPEQAYKSCMGVLSFGKKVGNERLINACKRALDYGFYNYKIIQTILEKGLDQIKDDEQVDQLEMPLHENIRGEDYYQ